jgi:hypothetical protein
VNVEKLLQEIIDAGDDVILDPFLETILENWVYFHFSESKGKDTKPGEGNIVVVLQIDSDNPILLPLVDDEQGLNGVIFTNSDVAIRLAEFNCKIGKMSGRRVFKMLFDLGNIDSVYIQGDYGKVRPSNEVFSALCTGLM